MTDTQVRIYALETAKSILGSASIADVLNAADEIYMFLTETRDPGATKH